MNQCREGCSQLFEAISGYPVLLAAMLGRESKESAGLSLAEQFFGIPVQSDFSAEIMCMNK